MNEECRGLFFRAAILLLLSTAMVAAADVPARAGTVNLPNTGQSQCWDSGGNLIDCAVSGYDGEYQSGMAWPTPRFSNNGDGTMTDNLTGLIWTKDAYSPTAGPCTGEWAMNWSSALDYVACLNSNNYLGHDDWRLPNVNQLESLVNAADAPRSWLADQGFTLVQSASYWSSTTSAFQTGQAWVVGMNDGSSITAAKGNDFECWAWPVRPGQSSSAPAATWKTGQHIIYYPGDDGAVQDGVPWPDPRFSDKEDGTVLDNLTGLIWTQDASSPGPQSCNPGSSMVMEEALDFIKCLNAENYLSRNDWRLPNRKELRSLTDYSVYGKGLLVNIFSNIQSNPAMSVFYWSSTLDQTIMHYDHAWAFGISGPVATWTRDYNYFYVWPVRGGLYADISIIANGTPAAVQQGQQITYSISITNNGPHAATDVALTDMLPSGTSFVSAASTVGTCSYSGGAVSCAIGDMPDGVSVSVTIAVTVLDTASGPITNSPSVSSSNMDADRADNSATVTTTVAPSTCNYGISPTNGTFTSSAGTGAVSVTSSGCNWTATSNASWITVTSGGTGSGSGTVDYFVSANTGTTARTGTITIAGRLFTVTQSNQAPQYIWEPLGPAPLLHNDIPYSGRVTSIAVSPTDSDTVYIGAAQGGVWKTTNGGTTWAPLTDDQASLATGALAIDPADPNTIYAGTGEANLAGFAYFGQGILKSVDGGSTWNLMGRSHFIGSSISKIIIHPSNPDVLWAATTMGSSGDGGYNYVIPFITTGISKSVDGGNSWTRVFAAQEVASLPLGVTDMLIDPSNPDLLYAGIYGGGIMKSGNGGMSWESLSNGLPDKSATGRVALALDPQSPTVLYATMSKPIFPDFDGRHLGTYKSSDGGSSWTILPEPQDLAGPEELSDICSAADMPFGFCFYTMFIKVAADGGVWLGGIGLWRSGDGGSTWDNIIGPTVHADQHAAGFDQNGGAWLGNDGGIYMSPDNGATWVSKNTNLSITQFYPGASLHPVNANLALGGTQDNGTLLFTGSSSWEKISGGDGLFSAIDHTEPNVWYFSSQYLSISKTSDGGNSSVPATFGIDRSNVSPVFFYSPYVMCPNYASILIAGNDTVWWTGNGAMLWIQDSPKPLIQGEVIRSLAFAPSDATCDTYFAGTANDSLIPGPGAGKGSVLRHDATGWTDISGNLPARGVSRITVDPADANTVYVTLSGFGGTHAFSGPGGPHVFRTQNALSAAPSWTAIDAGIPNIPVNVLLLDPVQPYTIYIGTDSGVYRSTDAGTSWHPFMNGHPNVAVVDLVGNAGTGAIISFTHGRGAFRLGAGACYYVLSPLSHTFSSAGGTGAVTVTPSSGSCGWSAASNASWLTITAGGSGMGNGTVNYSVSANTGAARTGTLTIAGQIFTVSQAAARYTLTVNKSGAGSGTVASSPSGINCGSACSAWYDAGTVVSLTAAPDGAMVFTGWSGGCSGTGACSLMMAGDATVTAGFANLTVKRISGGTATYFGSFQDAYNAASSGDIIEGMAAEYGEDLGLYLGRQIRLRGGYDAAFASRTGYSTINGSMTVGTGAVTIENMVIR